MKKLPDYSLVEQDAPLFLGLKQLAEREILAFHMPGNLSGQAFPPGFRSGWSRFETTELDSSGDILSGQGPVAAALVKAAEFAGAGASFFITQGCSTALAVALKSASQLTGRLVLPRTVHAAVSRTLALLGIEPIFAPLRIEPGLELAQVDLEGTCNLLRSLKEPTCVLLTRPDYYGTCLDLTDLVQAVRANGGILIVDEAHGAHLSINSDNLPLSGMELGADLVCQSAHKTWPSLAPAAMIQVGRRAVTDFGLDRLVKRDLKLFHSTSPSFPIAASIDWARSYLQLYGPALIDQLTAKLVWLKDHLPAGFRLKCPQFTQEGRVDPSTDLMHLLIQLPFAASLNFWNQSLAGLGIEAEMVGFDHLLLLLAPDSQLADFKKLVKTLDKLAEIETPQAELAGTYTELKASLQAAMLEARPQLLSNRQARLFSPVEWVGLDQAGARISADLIAPYPPGLPVIWPGELISPELADLLMSLDRAGLSMLGLESGQVAVVGEAF